MGQETEYHEGNVMTLTITKNGGSHYLLLTPEMKRYLNVEENKDGSITLALKADKGKWGPFFGIGKPKV